MSNVEKTLELPFSKMEIDFRRPKKKDVAMLRREAKNDPDQASCLFASALTLEARNENGEIIEKTNAAFFDDMDQEDWNVVDEYLEGIVLLGKKKKQMFGM